MLIRNRAYFKLSCVLNREILPLTIIVLRQHSKCVLFPEMVKQLLRRWRWWSVGNGRAGGRTDRRMVGATTSYRATTTKCVWVTVTNKAYSCPTPVMFAGRRRTISPSVGRGQLAQREKVHVPTAQWRFQSGDLTIRSIASASFLLKSSTRMITTDRFSWTASVQWGIREVQCSI